MDNTNTDVRDVNVDGVLDHARFRGVPLLVLLCAGCITVLDGIDIQIMGLTAPSVSAEWSIERAALVPAFGAALLGMALGGIGLGWLGDRYGRRPAVLASVLLFGLGTVATAFSTSLSMLVVLRLITGIGLGGAFPNATALMAEFSPPRWRSQVIAAAIIGVPLGGIVGAAVAAEVVPIWGWRAMFLVGGILPLLAWAVLYRVLPESPRFLAGFPGRRAELSELLGRIDPSGLYRPSDTFRLAQPQSVQDGGAKALWSRALRWDTAALWLAYVSNLFAVYCFYNWGPVVLASIGLPVAAAVRGMLVFNLFGVIGSLAAAWAISRLGSRWVQAVLCVAAIGALLQLRATVGAPDTAVWAVMALLAMIGFCVVAVQVTLFAVAAHVYPTHCRSVGVGWAQSMGRLGGIVSAGAGAVLLDTGFFASIAGTLALTTVAILAMRNPLKPVTPSL
jgi:MFS transporter, AAHS family, 4-hydroxybenzoate transporter